MELLTQLPAYAGLTKFGSDYVARVLSSPPARKVGRSALCNISGTFPGARFGHLIQYESAGCERTFVLHAIHSTHILGLWDQPQPIIIKTRDRRGYSRPRPYVADYLAVERDRIVLVEAKTEQELLKLEKSSPDWLRNESGRWTFEPAEAAAGVHGIEFEVFCPDHLTSAYRANLQILVHLPKHDLLQSVRGKVEAIRRLAASRPQTVAQICSKFDQISAAHLYQAILAGRLFGDLTNQHFDPNFVIYGNNGDLERAISTRIPGASHDALGPLHQRLLVSSPMELEAARKAMHRYEQRREQAVQPNSTDYRWRAAIRKANSEGAPMLAAFIPKFAERGGKGRPLPADLRDRMVDHAQRYLSEGRHPCKAKMYADFCVELEELGLPRPSRETHRRVVLERLGVERAALLSGGKRAFHAARPRVDGALMNPRLLIAGLWAHLDGVYGDVRARPDDEERLFPRPIFYPMVDDATGYILGRGVKVGRPSRIASLMAARDCYQRHGILPREILTDRGGEFVSHAMRILIESAQTGHAKRPSGAPRNGGVGEMLNGPLSSFLQGLAGGTYFDKKERSADGSKKSRKTARLSTADIVREADKWMFEIWNKSPFGGRTSTPEDLWLESRRIYPEATVPVTDTLMMRYLTSMPIEPRKIEATRGLRFGGESFTNVQLASMLHKGEKPSGPRLDCMDPSLIYVMTRAGPLELRSSSYQRMRGLDAAQRSSEMRVLLRARSTADSNQLDRNTKEARLQREIADVSTQTVEKWSAEPSASSDPSSASTRPDFSRARANCRALEALVLPDEVTDYE